MFIKLRNDDLGEWQLIKIQVELPLKGLKDDFFVVDGYESLDLSRPNPDKYATAEIDAIHTFVSAKLTLALWQKAIGVQIKWGWNDDHPGHRLRLLPESQEKDATFYFQRAVIEFGRYGRDQLKTAISFDIVSHEVTHAIIASLELEHAISSPIIEAFCDLTPIFVIATNDQLIERLLTSPNLDGPNFLSEFAEGFSGHLRGLRSALDSDAPDSFFIEHNLINKTYRQIISILKEPDRHHRKKKIENLFRNLCYQLILGSKKSAGHN